MFYQLTAGTVVEYQHALSQSGGHINPTWVLLGNHSTLDVFPNRRFLKNISKSDRALEFFLQEDIQLQTSKGTSRDMEQDGSTQEVSITSCPCQRWHKKTGVLRQHRKKQVPRLPTQRRGRVLHTIQWGSILLRYGCRGDVTP